MSLLNVNALLHNDCSTNGNGADNLASNSDVVSGAQRGTNGLSSANLRGQGSASTLVLLNGRRVAAHGLQGSAVDVNQIPFAAIERVEVLKDGASAIYGTDAIGGVINFITRKDYRGIGVQAFTDLTEAGGYAAASELLAAPDPPDAIWASLDRLALGVLLAARAREVRVPDDLLVVGTTDSDASRWASPALTALNLRPQEIGTAAVTMLLDLVGGKEPPRRHVVVGTRLIARASTKRPD